ncbi:MAG TPA: glycosyltransferase [Candidatus Eremiobacteraeota bacterium]|nr:MAG: Hyaluronan synthase [bacterium ADurb.Bin363]HPZ09423.1 glycosyltransferase [Candidatus Eremiobacteraeota bacterium]
MKIKISVIIPLYNHEKYIEDAIESVLSQTFTDFELIIIDDGSTDKSGEIVKNIADKRIQYIYQENSGAATAINRGIKIASGEYITILNSDDIYYLNRFEEILSVIEKDGSIYAVFSYLEIIDSEGNFIRIKKGPEDNWINKYSDTSFKDENNVLLHLLEGNFLVTTSNLFCRRSVFEHIGYFSNLRYTHDYDFFLRLSYKYKVHIIEEPLLKYRMHNLNTISESVPSVNFEVGLVLANFLSNSNLKEFFCIEGRKYYEMVRFFNSINTFNSDRFIMTFLIFAMQDIEDRNILFRTLGEDLNNPFRKNYIEREEKLCRSWQETQKLNKTLEETNQKLNQIWQEYQDLRKDWDETKLKLHDKEFALQDITQKLQNTEKTLQDKEKQLKDLLSSRPYLFGLLFRDATLSRKMFLLFPFRFIWFFVPSKIKSSIKNSEVYGKFIEKFFPERVTEVREKKVINQKWPYSLVSVIIPCYNYGKYLEEAIDSVLNQTFQNFEIIVVDDGSSDPETIEILNKLNKPKTRLIRQKNQKLPSARNNGIKRATGKYICCLDADDKLKPTYLEKCILRLERENTDLCTSLQENFGDSTSTLDPGVFSIENLMNNNCATVSSIFKKEIWKKAGGYNKHMVQGYEDWDFWIKIAKLGARASKIEEPLFLYRKHGKTMIDTAEKNHEILYEQIKNNHRDIFYSDKGLKLAKYRRNIRYIVENKDINLFLPENIPEKNKRLLMALPFMVIGGADTILLQIMKHLNNFHISVITTIPVDEKWGDNTPRYERITKEVYHLYRFLKNEEEWKDFIFYLIESRKIDIIFIVGCAYIYSLLPEIRKKYPSIKFVDQLFNEFGHIENNRKYAEYIDLNIVENLKVKEVLIEKYNEQKIKLIHNGVNLNYFSPDCRGKSVIYEDYGVPENKFIISFFGRFAEEKGTDIFIEIVRSFKEDENIFFIMAGGGLLFDYIQALIKKYDLDEKVITPGFIDTKQFLEVTDLIIVPSRLDGRPNIVLESLSMGIPVVASDVGGLPGTIKDGYNGFLCNSEDTLSFVEKIKLLYNDESLRMKMSRQAREYALQNLDITKMYREYEDAFLKLLL